MPCRRGAAASSPRLFPSATGKGQVRAARKMASRYLHSPSARPSPAAAPPSQRRGILADASHFVRGSAPNIPRGSRPSSFGPASAVRAEALIPLFDRQRCPPAAPHSCPKTPCFGHGTFSKPHRCPKTLHFGNKMLAPTIFVSRNGHFGARTPRRTPSDGQGLISGATPCPHFGHPGASNGQGPHHEIRPCPLKYGNSMAGVPGLQLSERPETPKYFTDITNGKYRAAAK